MAVPEEICFSRSVVLDVLAAVDDAIDALESTRHLGLVMTLEDQRLLLFDGLWPDFPHDG
ncbi:MAG: hypothetical protein JWN67_4706 [Actinomycetia bacterium]|nr:hypothetical protein [Actinomycetes bacterium]